MADAVSPRRWQYVVLGRQHCCSVGPVRSVPDKYAFQATGEQKDRRTVPSTKASVLRWGHKNVNLMHINLANDRGKLTQ